MINQDKGMIRLIKAHQSNKCGFLRLEAKDLLQMINGSKCIAEGKILLATFKQNFDTITPNSPPVFPNLTLLATTFFTTAKTCIE